VARHRLVVEDAPTVLLEFRPDDWLPANTDISPYWAWLMARFEWARTHPNDLSLGGDVLDMLRQRVAFKRGVTNGF
jgi:hypothetical protein